MMKKLILLIFLLCTTPAWATNYYVNPGNTSSACNTNPPTGDCDGTTHAKGFRTIANVNAKSFTAGDDVYFLCGGTWLLSGTEKLYVDWDGASAENRSVIGAYHMVDGSPVLSVSGAKPIFNGQNSAPGSTSGYNGIIELSTANYVTVENIRVINSQSYGIFGSGNYTIIQNCETSSTKMGAIVLSNSDNGEIKNNNVTLAATCYINATGDRSACADTVIPNAVGYTNQSDNNTISGNYIYTTNGEAIGIYYNCDGNTITNNIISAAQRAFIYVSGHVTDTTISYNMLYGTTDTAYWRYQNGLTFPSPGIWVDDENLAYAASSGNIVYGNLVAGTGYGFDQSGVRALTDSVVYNNTFVDNRVNISIDSASNSIVKNNISYCLTSDGTWPCVQAASPSSGVTWDYNLFSTLPSDADARGANDPTAAAPVINKTSGWRSITAGSGSSFDFELTSSSPAIGVGVALGSPYDTDYNSVTRPKPVGGAWDIGAFEYPAPAAPSCGDSLCNGTEVCGADDVDPSCNTDCGACPVGDPALKIQWKLDTDSAETEQDDTANNLDLTLSGTSRVTGFIDSYARSFNGTSDYAYRAAVDGLKAKFSLCGWFQVSESGRNQALFGTGSTNNYRLRLSTDNKVVFSTTAVSIVNSFSTSVGLNEWHHVCGTYDGTNQKLYLDGALVDTDAASVPAADSIINVGRTIWGEYLKGKLDDIRIYDGAIDAAAVLALYEAGAEPETDETAPTVTEYQVPSVPLAGIPVYKFVTTEAGTISLVGPCKTATTTATAGINEINFSVMGKGTYSDCTLTVTDASSNATTLNISPFTVDYWTLSGFGSGGVTITPSATGAMTLYFGGALPE